jgi:hypothetical protein
MESKSVLKIIFIILIFDSISHIYEALRNFLNLNILQIIFLISFRVVLILSLLYFLFKKNN